MRIQITARSRGNAAAWMRSSRCEAHGARRSPVDVAATESELMRAAILLAHLEAPALQEMPDGLEARVAELLELGEDGIRRRGVALRRRQSN